MELTRRLVLLGGASFGAAACASAAKPQQTESIVQARAIAQELLNANPIPALSLAVMKDGNLVWAEAYGKADIELDVDATTKHRFRLGSVSKVVTATLAAILADKSVVDLDAPIARYMPDLPEQHRKTTLRQLLTHRGGVRHYIDRDWSSDAPGGQLDDRAYMSTDDILATFINDPLIAPPGTQLSYSTFGYTLASIVMQEAASVSFLDLIQNEIAAPLELSSLGPDAPRMIQMNRVSGYGRGERVRELPPVDSVWANAPGNNPAYKWAGGGLIATASDLAKFGAAHIAPGPISQPALDALFTVQAGPTDRSPPLGLGWRINRDGKERLRWHHAGGQAGARASLVVYPEQKLSIAFMSNMSDAPGDVLTPSSRFADAFL